MSRKLKFAVGDTVRVKRLSPSAMLCETAAGKKTLHSLVGYVGVITGAGEGEPPYVYDVKFIAQHIPDADDFYWSAWELEKVDV